MLYNHKSSTQIKTELRFSISILLQLFFYPKDTTAETIDKTQYFHRLRHNRITVIIHQREIVRIDFTIQSSWIHNFYTVVILIELYRAVTVVSTVADCVHQQLTGRPVRIIHHDFFSQSTDIF